ncbi:MAG: OST-HTH/LOTUS domain-containing protein, partial [Verrucomicrobia bacterium]|nr:OST-HTH/LOTUS domain-containing protein [Verrucomicrobiota bacterium]
RSGGAAPEPAVARPAPEEPKGPPLIDALEQVVVTLEALTEAREGDDPIWGSMIKQAIKRRNPGFNERAYGFKSFNDLLLDAQKRNLIVLESDSKSGGYIVRLAD